MKTLIALSVLFFTAAAWADPVAFSYDYEVLNSNNDQVLSKGHCGVRVGYSNQLKLESDGKLGPVTASVRLEYSPSQGGGDSDYVLFVDPTKSDKSFYHHAKDHGYRFGNEDVMVSLTNEQKHDFYFMNKENEVQTNGMDNKKFYAEAIREGTCFDGSVEAAIHYIRINHSFHIVDDSISADSASIRWTDAKKKCISYGESEHGSYCEQYETSHEREINIPRCLNE